MQRIKYILLLFLLAVIAGSCQKENKINKTWEMEKAEERNKVTDQDMEDRDNSIAGITSDDNGTKSQIQSVIYNKDGISAEYPKLISGGSEEERKKWNQIIYDDFNKILANYAFNPVPELTPVPSGLIPTILTIKNEIKLNNDNFISILYTANFNSPYSAHPTELVYTTNIDKKNSERLKLTDLVRVDKEFIKNFRTWDYISTEPGNKELDQAIKDYVKNLSDEDLQMGFETADMIGSGNLWGIYSYLTPDRLGISLGVPNYIGDHIEFEREFSKIGGYLKQDNK